MEWILHSIVERTFSLEMVDFAMLYYHRHIFQSTEIFAHTELESALSFDEIFTLAILSDSTFTVTSSGNTATFDSFRMELYFKKFRKYSS